MNIYLFLFDGFETLDAFGPVEVLSNRNANPVALISRNGGPIRSGHGYTVNTAPVPDRIDGVLLLPGGMGTRPGVKDAELLALLRRLSEEAEYVLSVCTGSALLAACGVLDGKRATSNKQAMNWVKTTSDRVCWVDRARWVTDGKFYTSSGVSAGMDMAVGFLQDRFGAAVVEKVCRDIEYLWNADPEQDPFGA